MLLPVTWPPLHGWDALPDGNWSAFPLPVGTPPQHFRATLAMHETHVTVPSGADYRGILGDSYRPLGMPATDRGNCFRPSLSSSWTPQDSNADGGIERLGKDEREDGWGNVSFSAPVTLSRRLCDDFPASLPSPPVARVGLRAQWSTRRGVKSVWWLVGTPASVLQAADPVDPGGLGYGYTAGAWYKEAPAAFALSSRDPSRYWGDPLEVDLSEDDDNLLKLSIVSIRASLGSDGEDRDSDLVEAPVDAVLDARHLFLELPEEACGRFQRVFGLIEDPSTGLFLLSDASRTRLQELKPNISIEVGRVGERGSQSLTISLPYAAFDHEILLNTFSSPKAYFPIRVASPQRGVAVLGRVFFQEA
ncbi:hypothetical protein MMYC01_210629 [Madurella mycetomatis]|uniref:Uncharacterized protein n=1 Tax=Madurella mycetomatis TaxID=100816 RepID=A0A175VQE6_9PEZI|nr:hypothetical protein MMYC01_210629 [Madurella mycetomatis]